MEIGIPRTASAVFPNQCRAEYSQASQNRLVSYDQDVLLSFELHYDGLKTGYDVTIGFSTFKLMSGRDTFLKNVSRTNLDNGS